MKEVSVDVVILSYDGYELLIECLESVFSQTVRPAAVIVVDNGSCDPRVSLVANIFPSVQVVRVEVNRGISYGFNIAVEQCRSKYIAWLNNDVVIEPSWLEIMSKSIDAQANVASCDSLVVYDADPDLVWSAGAGYSWMGSANFLEQGKHKSVIQPSLKPIIASVGCAAIYRRELFETHGLLDDTFFLGFEDLDWGLRLTLAGYLHFNVPPAVASHKVSQTVLVGSAQYVRHGQRNVSATFLKVNPLPLLLLFMIPHFFYILASGVYYFSRGRGRSFVQGKFDVIVSIPQILRARRLIQNQKSISPTDFIKKLEIFPVNSKMRLLGLKSNSR